jgi:2-iminoacetate synthase ThiH
MLLVLPLLPTAENWLAKMKRAGQSGIPARAKLVAGNANHSGDALEHLRAGKARYRIVLVNDHA